MLLDRSVPGEEPLVVFLNVKMLLQLFINANRNTALQRKGMEKNCQDLADSRWEMLLKVVG
jgi:hypothetical protein